MVSPFLMNRRESCEGLVVVTRTPRERRNIDRVTTLLLGLQIYFELQSPSLAIGGQRDCRENQERILNHYRETEFTIKLLPRTRRDAVSYLTESSAA